MVQHCHIHTDKFKSRQAAADFKPWDAGIIKLCSVCPQPQASCVTFKFSIICCLLTPSFLCLLSVAICGFVDLFLVLFQWFHWLHRDQYLCVSHKHAHIYIPESTSSLWLSAMWPASGEPTATCRSSNTVSELLMSVQLSRLSPARVPPTAMATETTRTAIAKYSVYSTVLELGGTVGSEANLF